jgi:hypothetical protein
MHAIKRMASTSKTLKMLHECDEFMSLISTPIKSPSIGLEEASNPNMKIAWQFFIFQF